MSMENIAQAPSPLSGMGSTNQRSSRGKGFSQKAIYKNCEMAPIDDLVKSHKSNYRWLSKKVHIQGVGFFQERGHTCSMPSV